MAVTPKLRRCFRLAARVAGQPGQDAALAGLTQSYLGVLYGVLGRSAEAEHRYQWLLALLEQAGRRNTSDYALVLSNLADDYL